MSELDRRPRDRSGPWVRTLCDQCGASGLWVYLPKHESRSAVWKPSLCDDCFKKGGDSHGT